jgi:predicted TIM-barrel fold metal-dependent hydrolase
LEKFQLVVIFFNLIETPGLLLMIIDFHTHLFPKQVRNNKHSYFRSEPAFKLLYESPRSRLVGAEELLNAMDEHQVDKAVVFGFPWKNSDTVKMHNDYIIAMVEKYPDRLIGLGCINPASKDAGDEAQRCLETGLRGIGELAFYQSGLDAKVFGSLAPIMQLCLERELPVLIHTNEPVGHIYPGKTPMALTQIYQFIKRFQKNTIVLAHWGGGLFFFHLLKKEVKEYLKNIYFDTAASPFLYDPEIYPIAVQLVGSDKILFGSDYPLLPPQRYFKEMAEAGLPDTQIKKICGMNAARLLGL